MSSGRAFVSLEVSDGMAVVSLGRPPVNAMSRAFMEEFKGCLLRAERDPAVRVIIVRSQLDGIFSAGADIRELQSLDPEGCVSFVELGQRLFARLGEIPKPIVAAIAASRAPAPIVFSSSRRFTFMRHSPHRKKCPVKKQWRRPRVGKRRHRLDIESSVGLEPKSTSQAYSARVIPNCLPLVLQG